MDINGLYNQLMTGNKEVEEQLFDALTGRFRLIARHGIQNREDAAEVVQKALMTVAEKYKDVEIETSFVAWANRILNNKILDHYRAHGRRSDRLVPLDESGQGFANPVSDPDMERRLLDCLKKAREANREFGRVLVLSYQGFKAIELCKKLGIERDRLYKVLSRARAMLRKCLDDGASPQ